MTMNGSDQQDGKLTRGAVITITQELFNDIIAKGIGFKSGREIDVLHVSNTYHNRAFELTIKADSDDNRFPVTPEGCRYPTALLELRADEDGNISVIGVHVE